MLLEARDYIDPPHTSQKTDRPAGNIEMHLRRGYQRNKNYTQLGDGLYANVYAKTAGEGEDIHEPNPHHVVKVMRSHARTASRDGTISYLKIANRHADSNPHFPRVHQIHSIESPDGSSHIIEMERLHPWHDMNISHEERMAAFHHAFHHEPPEDVVDHPDEYERMHRFGKYIGDRLEKHHKSLAPFSHLRIAMDKVHDLVDKGRGRIDIDLHSSNFMLRKTPVGTQLVITDPVTGRKPSIRRR